MKYVLIALVLFTQLALADTLVRDGATCEIPSGYNTAMFNANYNIWGMEEFCEFPITPISDVIKEALATCGPGIDYTPPDLPRCNQLVLSPSIPVFPCYEIHND